MPGIELEGLGLGEIAIAVDANDPIVGDPNGVLVNARRIVEPVAEG
jgi:hypothetical protein